MPAKGADYATPKRHVFAHSMWRTGSTALAKCFLDNPGYLVFYEPFHEHCGTLRAIQKTSRDQEKLTTLMGHPDWRGGYFDSLKNIDPLTGKQLWELYDITSAGSAVYNVATRKSIAYINACIRVAEAQNKKAYFGFCRSGLQQSAFLAQPDVDAFYLYRDPLAQFMSYNWPTNDYFAAATLVQLMHSRSLWPMVREFMTISWRERFRLKWQTPANKFESKLRKARRILARQSQDAIYAMFLLSHQASLQQAERNGLSIESTDQISLDASKRKSLEARFAISLAQIHPTPQKAVPEFDTSKHEARVSALLGIKQRTQA